MSFMGTARTTVSHKASYPPQQRRECFGGVALASSHELDYRVGVNNNRFIKRNNSTRGSFIDSIAKSMPMKNADNPLVRPNSPKNRVQGGQGRFLEVRSPASDKMSPERSKSPFEGMEGYRKLSPPEHGKSSLFLKASFNNSNCASSQVSENGRKLSEKYFKSERPWGGMPKLYKGESQFATTGYTGKKKLGV